MAQSCRQALLDVRGDPERAHGACRELGGQPDAGGRPPDRLLWAVNTFGEARASASHF